MGGGGSKADRNPPACSFFLIPSFCYFFLFKSPLCAKYPSGLQNANPRREADKQADRVSLRCAVTRSDPSFGAAVWI